MAFYLSFAVFYLLLVLLSVILRSTVGRNHFNQISDAKPKHIISSAKDRHKELYSQLFGLSSKVGSICDTGFGPTFRSNNKTRMV